MKTALALSILLAFATLAQDPVKTLPRNYQVLFDNQYVHVIHVRYEPHEKLPLHDHSQLPTVYVYLTDSGPIRFSHVEDHPFALTRRPVKVGDFRVSPGRLERHTVENLGGIPSEFLRVELKHIPLGLDDFQFRGNQAFDLTQTGATSEFASPQIAIQRLIVTQKGRTLPFVTARPVLLIAFSPAALETPSVQPKLIQRGELYWLEPNPLMRVESTRAGTAHLLAITPAP